jgi:hypothetical protein
MHMHSEWSHHLTLSNKNFLRFSQLPMRGICPAHLIRLEFYKEF